MHLKFDLCSSESFYILEIGVMYNIISKNFQ